MIDHETEAYTCAAAALSALSAGRSPAISNLYGNRLMQIFLGSFHGCIEVAFYVQCLALIFFGPHFVRCHNMIGPENVGLRGGTP